MSPDSHSPPAETRRQPLWRWLLQFRLRTLLALVTLAAVSCWWYVTPKTIREYWPSGLLIRREVLNYDKLAPEDRHHYQPAYHWGQTGQFSHVNVGSWELGSAAPGGPQSLVQGRYRKNKPHGLWTVYHVNGALAAKGKMYEGAKDGVWKTWTPEGRLLSEVTYESRRIERTLPMFGMGGIAPAPAVVFDYVTVLQGPARAWHANGQLKLDGHFESDRRQGEWKFNDSSGILIAEGSYQDGRRIGAWKIRNTEKGKYQDISYRAKPDR
jgi:hypothetical protein